MDDEHARPSDQQRAADRLHEVLIATALPLARSRPRVPLTAPSQELTMTIKKLAKLGQLLPDFCRRAYLGDLDDHEWTELSDVLHRAARTCREQVVIDVHDIGDSGGR